MIMSLKSDVATSDSDDGSEMNENVYCIFLHIVEGIGFNTRERVGDFTEQRKNRILLNASLNGVKFEVEGHSLSNETATIFNSNCIWECELSDIKRMKTDNRPVKLECYLKSGRSENSPRRSIGSLLLPIRGVQIVSNLYNVNLKLHWHKLNGLNVEWRQNKPEVYLMLIILKKNILECGQMESLLGKRKTHNNLIGDSRRDVMLSPQASETSLMLQSQNNIYVQLLEQVGLIQVGNNPDKDCDIFSVTLTFKQVKNFLKLLECEEKAEQHNYDQRLDNLFIFYYDFLGSNSYVELQIMPNDCYAINEKISLTFKSSLPSLRAYFQCIFYIPINIFYRGTCIANYRFDFSKYLPDDMYFSVHKTWTKNGTFYFDRLHRIVSSQSNKPSVDFIFTINLITPNSKRNNYDLLVTNETGTSLRNENSELNKNSVESIQSMQTYKCISCESGFLSSRHLRTLELLDKYQKSNIDSSNLINDNDDVYNKSVEGFTKDISPRDETVYTCLKELLPKFTSSINVSTDIENESHRSIGVNTETLHILEEENLCLKIVKELDEWKNQQMDQFLRELTRKEDAYLQDFKLSWEKQHLIWQARLESKLNKCERLNDELEKTHNDLNESAVRNRESFIIASNIKRDIEHSYTRKFLDLDTEMQKLKLDMQQRSSLLEIRNRQMQLENGRLEKEKLSLKEHIEDLKEKLTEVQNTYLPAEKLKDVLNDLRKQNEQLMVMEKSCNYYKEKWTRASHEISKLKIKLLKYQEEDCLRTYNKTNNFDLQLEEILNEEQDLLKKDQLELKSIKGVLFNNSDTSSLSSDIGIDEDNIIRMENEQINSATNILN